MHVLRKGRVQEMSNRKLPVVTAVVYPGYLGFRITGRDAEGKVIYDSSRFYRSRSDARKAVYALWPKAKVTFEVI